MSKEIVMWSAPFWDVTQCSYVVRSMVKHSKKAASLLKMGPTGCPETSVLYYQPTPPNIIEDRWPRLHRGGSLKSLRYIRPLKTQTWSYMQQKRTRLVFLTLLNYTLQLWYNCTAIQPLSCLNEVLYDKFS